MMTQLCSISHQIRVPLMHQRPAAKKIDLFAREVFYPGNETAPIFVFLQGGPGFAANREFNSINWLTTLAKQFRIVLLDQRGTGRSQPFDAAMFQQYKSPQALANYLQYFRADQIVQDCEYLREQVFKVKRWCLLGQSYGGFIAFHYLSVRPESLRAVFTTGGVPPLLATDVSSIYQRLAENMIDLNKNLYANCSNLQDKLCRIRDLLLNNPLTLGDGSKLSIKRLQDLGILFSSEQVAQQLTTLVDQAFVDSKQQQLRWAFAKNIANLLPYETAPIYAIMHESIYANGFASQWAADSVYSQLEEFSPDYNSLYFPGEAVRRAMFREYTKLRPLRLAADILAKKVWPKLYDMDRLTTNKVPLYCLCYQQDACVDIKFSRQVLECIPNSKLWLHKKYAHDALRAHGKTVINGLLNRAKL